MFSISRGDISKKSSADFVLWGTLSFHHITNTFEVKGNRDQNRNIWVSPGWHLPFWNTDDIPRQMTWQFMGWKEAWRGSGGKSTAYVCQEQNIALTTGDKGSSNWESDIWVKPWEMWQDLALQISERCREISKQEKAPNLLEVNLAHWVNKTWQGWLEIIAYGVSDSRQNFSIKLSKFLKG